MSYKKYIIKLFLIYFLTIVISDSEKRIILAKIGESVGFNVSHKEPNVRISLGDSVIRNWYDSGVKGFFAGKYSFKDSHFKIHNFNKDMAGEYVFSFSIPVSLTTANHELEYVYVVAADFECGLYIPQPFIIENDCHLAKDEVTAWCRLNLSRDLTNRSFPIGWRTADVSGKFMDVTYENGSFSEAHVKGVVLDEGGVFECYTNTIKCSTPFLPQNVFYARNKTARELTSYHIRPMTPANKQIVVCQANRSAQLECTYEWLHQDGGVVSKFSGNTLHEKDLIKDGVYECLATCEHQNHKCVLLADRVEFSSQVLASSSSLSYLTYILLGLVLVSFVVGSIVVYKKVISPRNKTKKDAHLLTKSINNTNNNNPDTTTPTTINNPTTTTHPTPSNSSHLIAYQTPPSAPNTTPHTPYVSVGMTLSSGHKGPFRKSSFRRTSSNKSAMEKINEEDSTERKPHRITINDSKGSVVGVALMHRRIYCVCSDRELLFVYHEDPPYNRLKPEEIALYGAKRLTDLAANPASKALFVPDYTDQQIVFRVHPGEEGSKGTVVRCKVDGNPASIDASGPHHAIIILKKNNMMKVEIYDIPLPESFSTEVTLQKVKTFELSPHVKLPLKMSEVKGGRLCLLYASGNFNRKRFDAYHVIYLDQQTRKPVGQEFKFPSDFVPCSIVSDPERGGVWVLHQKPNAPLYHLDHQLSTPTSPVESSGLRFCLSASHAIVGCSSKNSPYLSFVSLPQNFRA